MHSTMEIACYSTHTVDLKDNTLTRELKKIKPKPKKPAEKKSFKKRQLSHLPRPTFYNVRSTNTF